MCAFLCCIVDSFLNSATIMTRYIFIHSSRVFLQETAAALFLLCCCCGEPTSVADIGAGVIYPPLLPTTDAEGSANETTTKKPLFVGLIQSYDPSLEDEQLNSVGTIVGAEIALDHINSDASTTTSSTHRLFVYPASLHLGYFKRTALAPWPLLKPDKLTPLAIICGELALIR